MRRLTNLILWLTLITAGLLMVETGSPAYGNEINYTEQRILIPSSEGHSPLSAIMALPIGSIRVPVILFLTGSGRGSLDDDSRSFNPIRDLLRDAAKNGIASLRFDKRGTGLNGEKGVHELQTMSSYESDALDAFDALVNTPSIDPNRIIVMGHSLGGIFAIKVAEHRRVSGLILSATPSGNAIEFMREQQLAIANFNFPDQPELAKKSVDEALSPYNKILDNSFAFQSCPSSRCRITQGIEVLDDQSLSFWRELFDVDVSAEIGRLSVGSRSRCIGGSFDWVVAPYHAEQNCQRMKDIGFDTHTEIVPRLDHFLAESISTEESLRRFINRDLNAYTPSNDYFNKLLKWVIF